MRRRVSSISCPTHGSEIVAQPSFRSSTYIACFAATNASKTASGSHGWAAATSLCAPHLRGRALRRALAYIRERPREPLRVADLCRATGASERTLRRAFVEHLGVPPKSYLQARRLDGLRRELLRASDGQHRVNEAAHRWGFWHMGQLAADYRRWFGELPSQTLARSGLEGTPSAQGS